MLVGCVTCDYRIQCVSCTEDDAVRYWNTRPIEDEKDKEIESLKEDLEIQKNLTRQACFESNRAYAETEKWKKMLYDLVAKQSIVDTNPKVVIIGKDTDVSADPPDNDVGSMEVTKPSCLNCKYIIKDNFYYKFHCRRFPPTIMQSGSFDYPVVDEYTIPCGEYKEQDK